MYCKNCGAAMAENQAVCPRCAAPVGAGRAYCSRCDARLGDHAVFCSRCGAPVSAGPVPQPPYAVKQKSLLAAALLAFALGWLGVHNFYLGYTGKGVAQLLITVLGGVLTVGLAALAVFIWSLVEMVQLFTGAISVDGAGVPIRRDI